MRRLLVLFLALGAIGGFASGFAHLAHGPHGHPGHHGPPVHSHPHSHDCVPAPDGR